MSYQNRETLSKKRYEVTINIMSTHFSYHYSDFGWDLKYIFDQISNAMKKKLGREVNGHKGIL
jgi:hypothetical protein